MDAKTFFKRTWKRLKSYGFNLIFLSILTGLFSGTVITLYNICTNLGERYSQDLYGLVRDNPAFVPLLLIVLAAGAVLIGTLVRFVPMIRGSGIPQIEGAARGKFSFKWYVVLCSMFAASLACVFLGLAAGSEGPSLEMGGCCGDAVAMGLKRSRMIKRLQLAAGASAGFAVAFNAPVTGMIFALEEAFRSFSPQVFICSAISVITALVVRNLLRPLLGFSVGFFLDTYSFPDQTDAVAYGYIALAAIVVALVAVAFYYLMLAAKQHIFKKITFFKGAGKYIIPFVLAGAFGLVTSYAMGGGHSLLEALGSEGTGSFDLTRIFGTPLAATLAIIIIFRFLSMIMAMSCGVPCGVFVPMLAVGACIGALLSVGFQTVGFNPQYSDYMVVICMSVFFTAFVRAPITGLCMIFELTGKFTNFLPALIGIVIANIISELFRVTPGYEKCLEMFIKEEGLDKNMRKLKITAKVLAGSTIDGSAIKKAVWPAGGLVVERLSLDGERSIPGASTRLLAGDEIVFECETAEDEQVIREYLYEIVGNPDSPPSEDEN